MSNLIQIVYISRSTFAPTKTVAGIEPNVARILAKSRVNNRKRGLVGVLYFGDGCFFQCLEGEKEIVESLYKTLEQDDRHTDLKVLSNKPIAQCSFAEWSMKYVPLEEPMNKLMSANGYSEFDPYRFNADMIEKVLELLFVSNAGTTSPAPVLIETPLTGQNNEKIQKVAKLAQSAFAISVSALVISLAALFDVIEAIEPTLQKLWEAI